MRVARRHLEAAEPVAPHLLSFLGGSCRAVQLEVEQIRDKRREADYCRFRDEKLAQLIPLPEQDPPVDLEASGEQKESLEIPPQPSSVVEMPAIEMPRRTRAHQLPKKAIPAEQAELIQLLKSALLYAKDSDGQVPQAHIDHVYGALRSRLASKGGAQREESRKRRSPTEGPRRRPRRQYIYARTQDLYKKNPGLVAKYVRENIDWWEDGHRLPPSAEISELYTGPNLRRNRELVRPDQPP
ncbi:hypothetical protein Trydic_g15415 [Trypoxylus dichotomus]